MAPLPQEILLKTGALQDAIFSSANFSSIATDANGVIQIFNVGAERMLGYTAAEMMNEITPADISDPQEVIARAKALSVELGTTITPGFEALVFKASRGIEDIYELTYIRKDGTRFPALVSVTALRDAQDAIIGYLLIGADNTGLSKIASTPAERTEILLDFLSNSESDLSDLRAAQLVPDLPACARIAHRMLGSSRMIGAIELAEVCENVERAARQGSSEDVMMANAAMGGALGRLDAHLAEAKRIIAQ